MRRIGPQTVHNEMRKHKTSPIEEYEEVKQRRELILTSRSDIKHRNVAKFEMQSECSTLKKVPTVLES